MTALQPQRHVGKSEQVCHDLFSKTSYASNDFKDSLVWMPGVSIKYV